VWLGYEMCSGNTGDVRYKQSMIMLADDLNDEMNVAIRLITPALEVNDGTMAPSVDYY